MLDGGDGTYRLVIPDAKVENTGRIKVRCRTPSLLSFSHLSANGIERSKDQLKNQFQVIAENPAGAVEQTAIVQVRGRAQKPDFAQRPQNHEVCSTHSIIYSFLAE